MQPGLVTWVLDRSCAHSEAWHEWFVPRAALSLCFLCDSVDVTPEGGVLDCVRPEPPASTLEPSFLGLWSHLGFLRVILGVKGNQMDEDSSRINWGAVWHG